MRPEPNRTSNSARRSRREGRGERVEARKNRGVAIRADLRRGAAVTAVFEAAAELGAGLIVVGSHGRTGAARRVLDSVAEEILRRAKLPILIVHAYEEIERPWAPPFSIEREAGVRQP